MANYSTHKATASGKRQTIERKTRHNAKRLRSGQDSLQATARAIGAKVVK